MAHPAPPSTTSANRNLAVRLSTAAVAVPLLVALILWENPIGWSLWVLVAGVVCLFEFFSITAADAPGLKLPGMVMGGLTGAAIYLAPHAVAPLLGVIAVAGLTIGLVHKEALRTIAARAGILVLGVVYIAGLLTPVALLKRDLGAQGPAWLFVILSIIWIGDTTAYGFGRALGRHKLAPTISPGKTVEGAIGGLVGNVGSVLVAKLWYLPSLDWSAVLLLAVPAGVLGQVGDLCESALKRAYGVKDSGHMLPGHGGFLDRIDALIFAAPYVYAYAMFVWHP